MQAIKRLPLALALLATVSQATTAFAAAPATPIQHVIIVVGENRTFDHVYGTYLPKAGQKVHNLLSQGIVNADGTPGANVAKATQNQARDTFPSAYTAQPAKTGPYATLPQPNTTYVCVFDPNLPCNVPDVRFPANLPNAPYQLTKYVGYDALTGDPVHRFFQMWQQIDNNRRDLFVWTAQTVAIGPQNGAPVPTPANTYQGALAMGFYNVQTGDAPVFKALADNYAMSDNYHQAVMGGTGANFLMLVTGDAGFFTNPDGTPGVPYGNQIENPNPQAGTNNYYTQDGYAGGSYVNCSDLGKPGINGVMKVLNTQGYVPFNGGNCAPNTYYLVNNYSMYWNPDGTTKTLGSDKFVLPPQTIPTIADKLTAANVSWKYYTGGRKGVKALDPVTGIQYCGICDPLTAFTSVMTTAQVNNLQGYDEFLGDLANNTLPAVSYVRPFELQAGHPTDSSVAGYETFLTSMIASVKASGAWANTAIFITNDEGGGYYDSGYVGFLDFFGDGTRIPLVAVSPWTKLGYVDHSYSDHASLLKFIEANWGLSPISARSRDNMPNPIMSKANYKPVNMPAISDLMGMFDFSQTPHS